MKREIKFRAWNPHKNEMYSPEMLFINDQSDDGTASLYTTIKDLQETYELMQFTGLCDKNGKEIYDGDIMKCHQAAINIVHWYWDEWCYQNYHAGSLPLGDLGNPYLNGGLLACEVIGNIYENPELL